MNTHIDLSRVINIDSRLDDNESRFRKKLLDRMINEEGLLRVEDFLGAERELLMRLVEKETLVVEDENIVFAYPVSEKPTNHKVMLRDGREFFSMCAIDAMGSAFVFGQDVEIISGCPVSGEMIRVNIEKGQIKEYSPQTIQAIHVDLSAVENWAANC